MKQFFMMVSSQSAGAIQLVYDKGDFWSVY